MLKTFIQLFFLINLSVSLSAQQNKITGIWELQSTNSRGGTFVLSIAEHGNQLFGEFRSDGIGRGSFKQIQLEGDHLSFQLVLGTNYAIAGYLEFNAQKELQGELSIYGAKIPVKGKLLSKEVDTSPIESQPSWSPNAKYIAYTAEQYGNKDIWVASQKGKAQNLTNNPASDYGPAWSPDGKTLAFISDRGGSSQIYTMNSKGGQIKQLTQATLNYDLLQWSPDGKKILFSTPQGPYLVDSDGSSLQKLTKDFPAVYARFSPAGDKIAVTLTKQNIYDIATINLKDLSIQNLSDQNTPDFNQHWSPNGQQLLWISRREGNPEVYTMNNDGTNINRLTSNTHRDNNPSWSPDGQYIIWESRKTNKAEVFIMKKDGSAVQNLSNHKSNDTRPLWSPKRNKILFLSEREGNPKIYLINPDGSNLRQLSRYR